MVTRRLYSTLSLIFVSLLVCGSIFAQPEPGIESGQLDIPVPDTDPDNLVTYQSDASKLVFEQVQAQYTWVINQLNSIQAASTDPIEQAQIDKVIVLIQDKKEKLQSIDVYFGKAGTTFGNLEDFYAGKGFVLEDLVQKAENVANEKKATDLIGALGIVPDSFLSQQAKNDLKTLINNDTLKAMAGVAGNARMTISNVFVEPNATTPSNPDIKDQLVIVIATKKPTL